MPPTLNKPTLVTKAFHEIGITPDETVGLLALQTILDFYPTLDRRKISVASALGNTIKKAVFGKNLTPQIISLISFMDFYVKPMTSEEVKAAVIRFCALHHCLALAPNNLKEASEEAYMNVARLYLPPHQTSGAPQRKNQPAVVKKG